jgi:hypothetical protein
MLLILICISDDSLFVEDDGFQLGMPKFVIVNLQCGLYVVLMDDQIYTHY